MSRRHLVGVMALLFGLAGPARGGIGDPTPDNPCSQGSNARYRTVLSVLDVSGGGCGGTYAETVITCSVKRGSGPAGAADIIVEFYDEDGSTISDGPVCAAASVPTGSTVSILTGELPPPESLNALLVVVPGGSCGPGCFLHGSARVFSTGQVQCNAVRVDLSELCFAGIAPRARKNLTILKSSKQRGD